MSWPIYLFTVCGFSEGSRRRREAWNFCRTLIAICAVFTPVLGDIFGLMSPGASRMTSKAVCKDYASDH